MAPATRAAAKRKLNISAGQPSQRRKTSESARKAARKVQQPFPFLELIPEIRNRIYEYASDENEDDKIAPHLIRDRSKVKPYNLRLWKFFALTQICRLIRAEYRPLWMQRCSARLFPGQLRQFVETFTSVPLQLKHSPRLLQIIWDHQTGSLNSNDITPLLRLQAHCPQLRFEFLPHNIVCGSTLEEAVCMYCVESWHLADIGEDEDMNPWEGCTCPPPDLEEQDWEGFQYDQIAYTNIVRNFVYNATEAWLEDVRKGKVRVSWTFARSDSRITFRILYTQQVCDDTNNSKAAWDLLRNWGLFDLPDTADTDFLLVYEDTKMSKEGGYNVEHSVQRKIRFTKTDFE